MTEPTSPRPKRWACSTREFRGHSTRLVYDANDYQSEPFLANPEDYLCDPNDLLSNVKSDATIVTPQADLRLTHTIYDPLGRVVETRRLAGAAITMTTVTPQGSSAEFPVTEFDPPSAPDILTASITEYADDGLVKLTKSQIFNNGGTTPSEELITWFHYDVALRQIATVQVVDLNQDLCLDATFDDGVPVVNLLDTDNDGRPDHYNDPREVIMTYIVYDASGRQERVFDPRGNLTSYIHDGLGRVTETRAELSNGTPGFDYVSTMTHYDSLGRRDAQIDPLGERTEYGHDDAGRLTSVTLPKVLNAVNGERHNPIYSYQYDVYGNQTATTDPKLNVTEYTFDHFNRQISRTLPMGVADSGFVELSEYNDALVNTIGAGAELSVGFGQLEYSLSFEKIVTAHRYDNTATGGGRLAATFYYNTLQDYLDDRAGDGELNEWIESRTFAYDPFGRSVAVIFRQMVDSTPTTIREEYRQFDADGRLVREQTPEGIIERAYDRAGRHTTTSTRESAAGPVITQTAYHHDTLSRIIATASIVRNEEITSEAATRYYFDANGNLDATTLPNGITSDYVYDPLNRLTTLTHCFDTNNNQSCDPSDTAVQKYEYLVRADGKRIGATEQHFAAQGQLDYTVQFHWSYDELGRLSTEVRDRVGTNELDYIARYGFDLSSNRISKQVHNEPTQEAIDAFLANPANFNPDETINYLYDKNDRLFREYNSKTDQTTFYQFGSDPIFTGPDPSAGDATYQTSKNVYSGNLDEPSGNPIDSIASFYNLQGRLSGTGVTKTGPTVTSEYEYNSAGIRVRQTVDQTITTYLIDGQNPTGYAQVLEEREGSNLVKSYTLGHDVIGQARIVGTQVTPDFFLHDGHGSTRAVLDDSGEIVHANSIDQIFSYDAYGNPIGFTNEQAVTSHLYSGEWTDAVTGWQYLRARYYDPSTGTWNRLDDFGGNTSDPVSLHKYLYVHADPIQGVDPTGQFSVTVAITGISIGATLGSFALPIAGAGYLAATGQISPIKVWNLLEDSDTWKSAAYGLVAGSAVSLGIQAGLMKLVGQGIAKRITPGIGLAFALGGLGQSIRLTRELVTGQLPPDHADRYVATMIAGSILSVALGVNMARWAKQARDDADFWRLTAEDQANYLRGQQLLPSRVWNDISNLSPIQRGQHLSNNFNFARRALLQLEGGLELVGNTFRLKRENVVTYPLSGFTPDFRYIFGTNGSSVLGMSSLVMQMQSP